LSSRKFPSNFDYGYVSIPLDHEIAAALDIAYGTARTHLYKAIDKLGINKKAELQFLLRNWEFSKFDRDF